ncbi:transposase, partial [Algivirga pacifica]|uniref:Transposase n=1 Tax=Algivirga pacifica TaxID=1162670 RepID=A0ABP9DUB0_9BACT
MSKRKTWTTEEKLQILEEGKGGDMVSVCRKYGISTATYYNWKKKFESQGKEGLKQSADRRDPEWKKLEEEHRILQKLLIQKEIELETQRELLKKKFGTDDPRKI